MTPATTITAITPSTTQNRRRDRAAIAVAVAVGALLLALAVPRTIAYVTTARDDEIVVALARYTQPTPIEMQVAAESRRAALSWHDDAHLHADIAALELATARKAGLASREGIARIERAETEARAALELAPGQPYAWITLLYAALAEGRGKDTIAPLYRMAVASAPHDPALVMARVELGLTAAARGVLDDADRALVDAQIRLAAAGAPKLLAEYARQHHALGPVRAALARDTTLRARFDAAYLSSVR